MTVTAGNTISERGRGENGKGGTDRKFQYLRADQGKKKGGGGGDRDILFPYSSGDESVREGERRG